MWCLLTVISDHSDTWQEAVREQKPFTRTAVSKLRFRKNIIRRFVGLFQACPDTRVHSWTLTRSSETHGRDQVSFDLHVADTQRTSQLRLPATPSPVKKKKKKKKGGGEIKHEAFTLTWFHFTFGQFQNIIHNNWLGFYFTKTDQPSFPHLVLTATHCLLFEVNSCISSKSEAD